MEQGVHSMKLGNSHSLIWKMLQLTDTTDRLLMVFGFLGAICDGLSGPVLVFQTSKIINILGDGTNFVSEDKINKVRFLNYSLHLDKLHYYFVCFGKNN